MSTALDLEQTLAASAAFVPPSCLTSEHLFYLDNLRESGIINMSGSPAWVARRFKGISADQADEIVQFWMNTFDLRRSLAEPAFYCGTSMLIDLLEAGDKASTPVTDPEADASIAE